MHGNKVTEKITIRDQFGQVIYQDKKAKTKKEIAMRSLCLLLALTALCKSPIKQRAISKRFTPGLPKIRIGTETF